MSVTDCPETDAHRQAHLYAARMTVLRTLGLPRAVRRARGKRLRLAFLNVPARLARTGRRLYLCFPAAYAYVQDFTDALRAIRALPAFG